MSCSSNHETGRSPLADCDCYGCNVRRHLRSKEHDGEGDSQGTDTFVQSVDKRKIGERKTELLYKRCPIKDCDVLTFDLEGHLRSERHHVEVDPRNIGTLLKLVDKDKDKDTQKGKRLGFYRICPIEGCTFISRYIRSHLRRKHSIRNCQTLTALRKNEDVYRSKELSSDDGLSVPTAAFGHIDPDDEVDDEVDDDVDDDDGDDEDDDDDRQRVVKQRENHARGCERQLTKEDVDAAMSLLLLKRSSETR